MALSIKELSGKILNEYNHYHGKDGRFTSLSSSGVNTVTISVKGSKGANPDLIKKTDIGKGSSPTSPTGLITDKEKKSIDLGVKKAVASGSPKDFDFEVGKKVSDIREQTLRDMGIKQREIDTFNQGTLMWWRSPSHEDAVKMVVIRNTIMKESPMSGMSPNQIKTYNDKNIKVSPDEIKATAAIVSFNQKYLKQKFGNTIEVYRGVSGEQGRELAKSKSKSAILPVNSLSSFTTDKGTAINFAGDVLLTSKIKVTDVFNSHHTDAILAGHFEHEVIFSPGKQHTIGVNVIKR